MSVLAALCDLEMRSYAVDGIPVLPVSGIITLSRDSPSEARRRPARPEDAAPILFVVDVKSGSLCRLTLSPSIYKQHPTPYSGAELGRRSRSQKVVCCSYRKTNLCCNSRSFIACV